MASRRTIETDTKGREFIVTDVLGRRPSAHGFEYKVVWKGYKTPTWEPYQNLDFSHYGYLLDAFDKAFPNGSKVIDLARTR